MHPKYRFSPSLMCADLLNLDRDVMLLEKAGFASYHMDMMDYHFVPNLTLGFDLIDKFNKYTTPLDMHLMLENVADAVKRLNTQAKDFITFHLEAPVNTAEAIDLIKTKSHAGLAISPDTKLSELYPYLPKIDLLLIMSVYPGFAGAKFVEGSYDRAAEIVNEVRRQKLGIKISVDGGIGFEQIEKFSALGVDTFVLGTKSLFKGDLAKNLSDFTGFVRTLK